MSRKIPLIRSLPGLPIKSRKTMATNRHARGGAVYSVKPRGTRRAVLSVASNIVDSREHPTLEQEKHKHGKVQPLFGRRCCAHLYHRNVLAPISLSALGFDSEGMTCIPHCLPGSIAEKAFVFDDIRPLMNPRAVLFGPTAVRWDAPVSRQAKRFMDICDINGLFSNRHDTQPAD
jgi:hypothetical protein